MNQDSGAATHPGDIHRLLLSGPLAEQVVERLGAAYPGLETRVVSEGPPSSDDLS